MPTSFPFENIKIEYDSTKRMVWNGVSPWSDNYLNRPVTSRTEYFDVRIAHKDFDVNLFVIYWEDLGYELNPYVSRGSENLKTLHHRVRLTAKKEIVANQEIYLSQIRIAKIKNAIPPSRIMKYRNPSSFFGQPIHSNLFNSSTNELDKICKMNTKHYLLNECNALKVDKKRLITGDCGPKQNSEFVSFEKGNFKLMIILFIMTRIKPMIEGVPAK